MPTPERTTPQTADLLRRYDRPGPRYTSYPTAVEFEPGVDARAYAARLDAAAAAPDEPLSLYLHLPFCRERCTFCGCAVVTTRRREVAARYLEYLEREIAMLAGRLGRRRRIVQWHWGGGTPTYLSPTQIESLYSVVARAFTIDPGAEVAIEVDPRVTSSEHLDVLRGLGFNRLSMGVQDFTVEVQDAIGRRQTAAETRALFAHARAAGFDSINLDLIYGLPRQTVEGFGYTLQATIDLRPERVAVYSYAHVPWLRPNQRRIDAAALPGREAKFELLGLAIDRFGAAGYAHIGMDHFAVPHDELAAASRQGRLHRTFMGYTTRPASAQVGAGITAIGDLEGVYVQNARKLTAYYAAIDRGLFPVERGRVLDADDRLRREVIMGLMCRLRLDLPEVERRFGVAFGEYFACELAELAAPDGPVAHGFLEVRPDRLQVTERGRLFVRNICMTFDRYLRDRRGQTMAFSRTI